MIHAIVLDFLYVIALPSWSGSRSQQSIKDPSGLYELNQDLLVHVAHIQKEKDVPVFVFTQSRPAEYEWCQRELSFVTGIYNARALGIDKGMVEGYETLLEHIHVPAENILFIDDSEDNIQAAASAGYQTIRYTDNASLFDTMKQQFSF
jgi:FMN phosphatase YigB (HAD superfamily)